MSPESQRIAIAEACGWKRIRFLKDKTSYLVFESLAKELLSLTALGWSEGKPADNVEDIRLTFSNYNHVVIPDYINDLNAMHEAEKAVLNKNVRLYLAYAQTLTSLCGGSVDALFATSAQRAEAFLRTLGLWKDDACPRS